MKCRFFYLVNFTLVFLFLCATNAYALMDSAWRQKPTLHFSGFTDVFYAYDVNKPATESRQPFYYNHNRQNQININLALLRLQVEHPRYRVHLALQAGSYAMDNYAAEPAPLRYIHEARAGIALTRKQNLWLDAGIFSSHIGFESAVSTDNTTLTRSLLAENSPYYLAGAKLTYSPNQQWELAALLLNGWQRIVPVKGNSLPALGTQICFKPNEHITFNWSTFTGTDDPDSQRRIRFFNNLYMLWQPIKMLSLTAGFDVGIQQKQKNSKAVNYWLSPVAIMQLHLAEQWKMAIRGEYYLDENNCIISTYSPNGFRTTGASVNIDYQAVEILTCRVEGRWLYNQDRIFMYQGKNVAHSFAVAASLALRVQTLLGYTKKQPIR